MLDGDAGRQHAVGDRQGSSRIAGRIGQGPGSRLGLGHDNSLLQLDPLDREGRINEQPHTTSGPLVGRGPNRRHCLRAGRGQRGHGGYQHALPRAHQKSRQVDHEPLIGNPPGKLPSRLGPHPRDPGRRVDREFELAGVPARRRHRAGHDVGPAAPHDHGIPGGYGRRQRRLVPNDQRQLGQGADHDPPGTRLGAALDNGSRSGRSRHERPGRLRQREVERCHKRRQERHDDPLPADGSRKTHRRRVGARTGRADRHSAVGHAEHNRLARALGRADHAAGHGDATEGHLRRDCSGCRLNREFNRPVQVA